MNKISGHWFCDYCDDVVFMTYERVNLSNVLCPNCGRFACNFVPKKISRKELGEWWFAAMRRAVDEVTTPELPDQRHHKKIL